MTVIDPQKIQSAEIVLACADLTKALEFYVERLGFRLDAIFPADAPRVATISGYGLRIRLDKDADAATGLIRLTRGDQRAVDGSGDGVEERISPDGTRIQLIPLDPPLEPPRLAPALIVQRGDDCSWRTGRAGMQYRDLMPDRLGGRYIFSHIRIPNGGPTPDYVHHHHIQFQMIFCYRGWVRVVYEDQGPPIEMKPGDCVLQPPHIRHRVLASSSGMEVIEICCPAEHQTQVDHDMALPTASIRPDRLFNGQRFVFHQSANAIWKPGPYDGLKSADTGIRSATGGLASARVLRSLSEKNACVVKPDSESIFSFVLDGSVSLGCGDDRRWDLTAGDAFVMPAGLASSLTGFSSDFELLQVSLN